MAKFSEVINKRALEDDDFDPKYFTVRDTTGGLTDALYTNRGIDALGGVNAIPTWMTADGVVYEDRATVPSYKDIIAAIPDLKDDAGAKEGKKGARTALQKFVEDFPKMQKQWKKDLLGKDQNLGERGWETVKEVWKKTAMDYYDAKAKSDRAKVVDDGTFSGLVAKLMFPRITNAIREGRDGDGNFGTTWEKVKYLADNYGKELAGDLFQNAAYAVPAGFIGAPMKFGVSKLLPAAAQGVGKAATSWASQAAVPAAVYGMDKALGNETTWLDPVVGTLGNMGANKVLFPTIGRMAGRFTGSIRNPQLLGLKALMEGADTPRERGLKIIADKRAFLNEANKANEELAERTMRAGTNNQFSNVESQEEAMIIDEIGKAIENKDIGKITQDAIKAKPNSSNADIAADAVSTAAAQNLLKKTDKNLDKFIKAANKGNIKKFDAAAKETELQNEALDLMNVFIQNKDKVSQVFEKYPELQAALFKDKYPRLSDLGAAYGINQFAGNSTRPAEAAANAYGIPIKEWKKEDAEERAEAKRQSDISKILDAGNTAQTLTEQDKAYLADIQANPELVVTGYPDLKQNNSFKEWLLLRGHDLLRGTSAARPTWEVE